MNIRQGAKRAARCVREAFMGQYWQDFHEVREISQGGKKEQVLLYLIKEYEGHPTLEARNVVSPARA